MLFNPDSDKQAKTMNGVRGSAGGGVSEKSRCRTDYFAAGVETPNCFGCAGAIWEISTGTPEPLEPALEKIPQQSFRSPLATASQSKSFHTGWRLVRPRFEKPRHMNKSNAHSPQIKWDKAYQI